MEDFLALEKFHQENRKFDVVFLDPPYKLGKYEEIISLLFKNDLLSENAIIIIESDHDIKIDESLFMKRRDYKYGEIKVSIVWRSL
jgi:16S rRNA (guanine966-N2)-methyltransferase